MKEFPNKKVTRGAASWDQDPCETTSIYFFVLHGLCLTSSTLWLLRVTKTISPHNINTIWSRQVLRIQENITFRGLLIDPIPNSPNSHNKNCMAEIRGNYQWDLESEEVSLEISWLKLFSHDYPLRTLNNCWIDTLLIFFRILNNSFEELIAFQVFL